MFSLNSTVVTRNIEIDLNIVSNYFNLVENHISLSTLSDYNDFIDKMAMLNEVFNNESKIESRLCDKQFVFVDLILNDQNVFYTNSVNCDKSTILKYFIFLFKKEDKKVNVLIFIKRVALEINNKILYNYVDWISRSFDQPLRKLKINARDKKM